MLKPVDDLSEISPIFIQSNLVLPVIHAFQIMETEVEVDEVPIHLTEPFIQMRQTVNYPPLVYGNTLCAGPLRQYLPSWLGVSHRDGISDQQNLRLHVRILQKNFGVFHNLYFDGSLREPVRSGQEIVIFSRPGWEGESLTSAKDYLR